MTGERWVLRGGVWRRPGWDAVQPGHLPTDPGGEPPPPEAPRFRVNQLGLAGSGSVPTDPPPTGGGGGGSSSRPQFGACILSTGAAGVVAKYGQTASIREFLSSSLTWSGVPAGSKMQRSYKLVDNGVVPTQAQVDTFLHAVAATGDRHVVTFDHEPDNNGWTSAKIAQWKANNNLLYDRIEALGLKVYSAPTFTGGLWSSNQSDTARDTWMVGLRGHLIGIDYDGVHDNATSRPSDNRYRRGGTIITNADEIATAKRYLTRFAANGWLGITVPEFGISRASWDTDGTGRTLWLTENGQRFIDAGVLCYLVQWYDFRDTKTGISDIIDAGTKELAQMRSYVALNQAV